MDNNYQRKLVKRAMNGDREAFELLIELRHNDILYFAISLSNQHDGEDIAQEAIIRIQRDICTLKDPMKFNSWMFSVVRHTGINIMNKINRSRTVIMQEESYAEDRREFLPTQFLEDKEKREAVMEVIGTLPDNYRECLILYYYMGMSYKEIAETLETNFKKVSNDLTRARALIKERVEKKTNTTLMYNIAPIGTIPILTQIYKADATAKITADIYTRIMEGVHAKLVNTQSKPSSASNVDTHSSIGKVVIASILTTVVLAGIVWAIYMSNTSPSTSDSVSPVEEISPETVTPPSEPASSVNENLINTLADMVGDEYEAKLLSFEKGEITESAWQAFLKDIGVTLEEEANQQDDIRYRMYLLQKQDKQLILMEKKDLVSGKLVVMHRFGNNIEGLPFMFEIILLFDE